MGKRRPGTQTRYSSQPYEPLVSTLPRQEQPRRTPFQKPGMTENLLARREARTIEEAQATLGELKGLKEEVRALKDELEVKRERERKKVNRLEKELANKEEGDGGGRCSQPQVNGDGGGRASSGGTFKEKEKELDSARQKITELEVAMETHLSRTIESERALKEARQTAEARRVAADELHKNIEKLESEAAKVRKEHEDLTKKNVKLEAQVEDFGDALAKKIEDVLDEAQRVWKEHYANRSAGRPKPNDALPTFEDCTDNAKRSLLHLYYNVITSASVACGALVTKTDKDAIKDPALLRANTKMEKISAQLKVANADLVEVRRQRKESDMALEEATKALSEVKRERDSRGGKLAAKAREVEAVREELRLAQEEKTALDSARVMIESETLANAQKEIEMTKQELVELKKEKLKWQQQGCSASPTASVAPSETASVSRATVVMFTKTISELTKQNSVLRNENMNLVLQMAGVEISQ